MAPASRRMDFSVVFDDLLDERLGVLDHLQRGALDEQVQLGVVVRHGLPRRVVLPADDDCRACTRAPRRCDQ